MGIFEIILIGIGLSMDAAAVSITNGLAYPNLSPRQKLAMPIVFGLFQGIMPLLGYFVGGIFSSFISGYAGIVTFVILGFVGGKMIHEALQEEDGGGVLRFTLATLLVQGIATSIDAFAVGVSFRAASVDIWLAAGIITITTFACSLLAVVLGKKIGQALGKKAELFGGIVLVLIGIKALF